MDSLSDSIKSAMSFRNSRRTSDLIVLISLSKALPSLQPPLLIARELRMLSKSFWVCVLEALTVSVNRTMSCVIS